MAVGCFHEPLRTGVFTEKSVRGCIFRGGAILHCRQRLRNRNRFPARKQFVFLCLEALDRKITAGILFGSLDPVLRYLHAMVFRSPCTRGQNAGKTVSFRVRKLDCVPTRGRGSDIP